MKKLLLCLVVACIGATTVFAQSNPGCDGTRYKDNVFATATKTTVMYATTVNVLGTTMNLSMDVYQPTGDTLSVRSAVVLAHGGSFILGDKSLMQPYAELLAKKGYVAVSIQYRLFPFLQLGTPDSTEIMDAAVKAMGDMKAAVRFLRLDAATDNSLRIDPNHIFIGGYSAGAVTALHAAYVDADDDLPAFIQTILANNNGFEGASGSAANQSYSSAAEAVINMSGGLYRAHWVDANDAPLSSVHGTVDATVPFTAGLAAGIAYLQGSSMIHTRAVAEGVSNYLETVTGAGHSDLYNAAQFADELANFWVTTTTMLEYLTCSPDVSAPEHPAERPDWRLAPNPATTSFRAEWPAAYGAVTVRIFNTDGRLVRAIDGVLPGQAVPVADLPAGTYAVQLLGQQGRAFGTRLLRKVGN